MIKNIFLTAIVFVLAFNANAQNDTMYIMKNGIVAGKYNVNTEVDSVIFYQPALQPVNSFTDSRDGNVYQFVTIGNQVWMAENLAYLPNVAGPGTGSETIPYYYVYGYDGTNVTEAKSTDNYNTYGVLYNWPAAMNETVSSVSNPSGVQGVCPSGWHMPSDAEWTELENHLADNGYNYDGSTGGGRDKIAKSLADTSYWTSSTGTGAIGNSDYPEYFNKSGFSALPGGRSKTDGSFEDNSYDSNWWSSTESSSSVYYRRLRYSLSNIYRGTTPHNLGFSVRCLKD